MDEDGKSSCRLNDGSDAVGKFSSNVFLLNCM